MVLRALIVDDEYPARKELRYLLEKYDNIQIVGEAANAREAMELINAVDYSVVFLDIDMPGGSGLELGRQLQIRNGKSPYVVFITAHDQYALEAFGVDAVDYILKPIDPKRLDKAIKKIQERIQPSSSSPVPDKSKNDTRSLGLIPVEHKGKTILLEKKDIVFISANNDYCFIKTYNTKYLTRFTLKELEKRLDSNLFFRCHRSYLVNIQKTREIIPLYNGTLILIVDDEEKSEVPVSRSHAKQIRQILGI
ncbi:LytR/AlgR family response regulator transcription factor [Calderihabitans maritimus]|uniref:Stage 0 sporulation protein A homolog n=1 Tax=Calderihabitans maritimus TaxID=1246530 RepID=A0A1Z5HPF8_9FIRM|nr:LytTR family transcriptional regulator DNA-binding domain-containing protein [Calderihabitans maritimus]GAW91267.1 DNA-binding response regulator [Calderihabitans maritimus]